MSFLFAFWWLIFPIIGFATAAFGMWTGYLRHKQLMELMKTYAAQGKDPAEVAKAVGSAAPFNGPAGPWGGAWSHPWGGGATARWANWGPFAEWRRFVVLGSLAAGFGVASYYDVLPGTHAAFGFVAIILGVLALGNLVMAVIATSLSSKLRKDGE